MLFPAAGALVGCGSQQNRSIGSNNRSSDEEESGILALRGVIAVPGNPLAAYDISWVDQATQMYYLADRSNAGVDIINARNNTFVGLVPGFVGADPRGNDFSGPNGVLAIQSQHQVWAGDGPGPAGNSSVKVIDLTASPPQVIDTIHTNGARRSDEMAYDPRDHILAVVNNADDPPFLTLISTRPPREVLRRITFDAALGQPFGVHAFTGGLEQPVWDPETQHFYLSVPALDVVAEHGAIAVINPRTGRLTQLFRVNDCAPAGLTLGPRQHLLIGCSDPSRTIVIDADGAIVREILEIGGSDEVWFNPRDERYYLAARDNPSGPVLGVIDAEDNTFVTRVSTAFNSHSVAVNERNSHIFVPLTRPRPNHVPPDPNPCVAFGGPSFAGRGCIGVYWRSGEDDPEG